MAYAWEPQETTREESKPSHKHSYSSSVTQSPTCEGTGVRTYTCSGCASSYTESIPAKGHNMGDWYDNGNNHRKDCSRCSHYETAAHSGGSWYHENGNKHYKNCSTCGHTKYTSGSHNKGTTQAYGNDDKHHMKCTDCAYVWPSGHDEKHNWAHAEGDHTCSDCGEVVAGEHHYYIIGGEAEESYDCQYTANGNPCTYSIQLAAAPFSGTPIGEYCCSDALVKMVPVKAFKKAIHDFSYTGTLYDSPTGAPYTDLKSPENWFKLFGWWQRNVVAHASEGRTTALSKLKKLAPKTAAAIETHKATGDAGMDVDTYHYVNLLQDYPNKGWDTTYDLSTKSIIHAGMGEFTPEEEFDGKTFKVDYTSLSNGGWFYWGSPFFDNDDLFRVGSAGSEGGSGVPTEEKTDIYADVYYIYMTKDENGNWTKIPLNGYPKQIQLAETVVVYSGKRLSPKVYVTADTDLIDNSGYRYVRIFYK